MKVITVSRGHVPRMRAHRLCLPDMEHHFVFNTDEQRQGVIAQLGLRPAFCHVSNTTPGQEGAALNREWAEQNLTDAGEWYVTIDDNIGSFTWLPLPYYNREQIDFGGAASNYWRGIYDTPCPPEQVAKILREQIWECERCRTVLGGFSIENNFYFRGRKWQRFGYVRTSCAVVKNVGLPWHYWPGNMLEDFTRSVDVVARYGSVVINRYLKAVKPFFEAGGIGTFEERRPNLVAVSEELMRRYPGLVRPNKGQDFQLTFALRSENTVNKWRKEHGYL